MIYQMLPSATAPEAVATAGEQPESQLYVHLYLRLDFDTLGNKDKVLEHVTGAADNRHQATDAYMHMVARIHRTLIRGRK